MYRIIKKETLTPVTKLYVIEAPDVARKAQAGQFIVLRVTEEGERIPLTIADYDRAAGTITIVVQELGKSSKLLGTLSEGDSLASFTGPLGRPTEIEHYGTVVLVGGGLGMRLELAPGRTVAAVARGRLLDVRRAVEHHGLMPVVAIAVAQIRLESG